MVKIRSPRPVQRFIHFLGEVYRNAVGKSFGDKSHLDDLLSIPDFAAGVVQDALQAQKTGDGNIPGGEEEMALVRWITTQRKFLSKITIQISKLATEELGSSVVEFTLAKQG
jgi:hypothetical protein